MTKYITKNRIYFLLIIIANVLASEISHTASEMRSGAGVFLGVLLTLAGFVGLLYFVRITIYRNDSEWMKHIFQLILIYIIIKIVGSSLISAVVFIINKLGLVAVDTSKIILERANYIFHMIVNVVVLASLMVKMDYDSTPE